MWIKISIISGSLLILIILHCFYRIYKETETKEYKKGYSDYPNDEIYKMCRDSSNNQIMLYKSGWESAKSNDLINKEKEIINKILNK